MRQRIIRWLLDYPDKLYDNLYNYTYRRQYFGSRERLGVWDRFRYFLLTGQDFESKRKKD
jgi:hypothetical protein